jgi:hypothetical protein
MRNSAATRQFLAFARGDLKIQRPRNPIRVERVIAREMYCMQCLGIRWFDVAEGIDESGARYQFSICRRCEAPIGLQVLQKSGSESKGMDLIGR